MLRYRKIWWVPLVAVLVTMLPQVKAHAFIDGLRGTTFNFAAKAGRISTPDGFNHVFWGFANISGAAGAARTPQYPGPTLILTEGQSVTVNLANELAEPVSLIFPGMTMVSQTAPSFAKGAPSQLRSIAPEALPGGTRQYQFTATKPGTYYYQSGSDQSNQVRMGLFGAIIVRPASTISVNATVPATLACPPAGHREGTGGVNTITATAPCTKSYTTFAYTPASTADDSTVYDREYLFLISEMDPGFQRVMEFGGPYDLSRWKANYWFMNGRAAPDTMNMAAIQSIGGPILFGNTTLPNQPYNCMPLAHPGERVLLRVINMGQDPHPFHTHGNHVRVVARDGNLQSSDPATAGADLAEQRFTMTLTPGGTLDSIFTWTGDKIGWEIYNHINDIDNPPLGWSTGGARGAEDFDYNNNGIFDVQPLRLYENIADHGRHFTPFVSSQPNVPTPVLPPQGVPVSLPTIEQTISGPNWSGSPYLGNNAPLPPGEGGFNPFNGYFFMWHSHSERELTNNDIFPGGFLTMFGVVPWPLDPAAADNMNAFDEFVM